MVNREIFGVCLTDRKEAPISLDLDEGGQLTLAGALVTTVTPSPAWRYGGPYPRGKIGL